MKDNFVGMYNPNCPICLLRTVLCDGYWACGDCGLIISGGTADFLLFFHDEITQDKLSGKEAQG